MEFFIFYWPNENNARSGGTRIIWHSVPPVAIELFYNLRKMTSVVLSLIFLKNVISFCVLRNRFYLIKCRSFLTKELLVELVWL
jgi:hypothetical protein